MWWPIEVPLLKWVVNKIYLWIGSTHRDAEEKDVENNYVLDALMFWENIFWGEILIQR